MKQNNNPNFLDSATSYWSAKFSSTRKTASPNTAPQVQVLPQPIFQQPVQNPQFFPNQTMFPQNMTPYTAQNPGYFGMNPNIMPMNRFQNLVPNPLYLQNVKILPSSTIEPQPNAFMPSGNPFYGYPQPQPEGLFGQVLQKAKNYWQCSPASTQSHIVQRSPYIGINQGYHSDPLSGDNSFKASEIISWESTLSKPLAEPQLKKKISKKSKKSKKGNFHPKEGSLRPPDSVSIAKKLLAIASNWEEVCKKIPVNMQTSFKEKMKRYVRKKILPDLQLRNRIQSIVGAEKPEWSEGKMDLNCLNPYPEHENISTNPNIDEPRDLISGTQKFDDLFGQDLDRLLISNDPKPIDLSPLNRDGGMPWRLEIESPTLSKILKNDAFSVNFEGEKAGGFEDFVMNNEDVDKEQKE